MRRLRFSTSTDSPPTQQLAASTAPVVRPVRLNPVHAPRQARVQKRERKRLERATPTAILLHAGGWGGWGGDRVTERSTLHERGRRRQRPRSCLQHPL